MSESRLLLADNVLTCEPPATCHEHVMDTCWLSKQMFTDCQSIDWFTITYYLLLSHFSLFLFTASLRTLLRDERTTSGYFQGVNFLS